MDDLKLQRDTMRRILSQYCKTIKETLDIRPPVALSTLKRQAAEVNRRLQQVIDVHSQIIFTANTDPAADINQIIADQDQWLEGHMTHIDILNERIEQLSDPSGSANIIAAAAAPVNTPVTSQNTVTATSVTASERPSETRAVTQQQVDNLITLPVTTDNLENVTVNSDSTNTLRSGIKLTKLELATFDGTDVDAFADYKEDHFTNIFCNKDLTGATRMSYLRRTCKGEAYKMISGYPLTQESYETAWRLLCQRYGRPERTAMRHISALLHLEPPKQGRGPTYVSSLYNTYNEVNFHVRGLETLLNSLKAEDILVPMIISKFPNNFLHEFSKTFKGKDNNLQSVLNFLESECQRYEYVCDIAQSMGETTTAKEKYTNERRQMKGSAVALHINSSDLSKTSRFSCYYCHEPHYSRDCTKFWKASISNRRDMVLQANLCFKCLRPGHMSRSCLRNCTVCKGEHATPLCDNKFTTNRTSKNLYDYKPKVMNMPSVGSPVVGENCDSARTPTPQLSQQTYKTPFSPNSLIPTPETSSNTNFSNQYIANPKIETTTLTNTQGIIPNNSHTPPMLPPNSNQQGFQNVSLLQMPPGGNQK